MYVCVPDVDESLAAYPRQKFRIMQSKHLLITFIISTATVAQSRNLTPDPPVTPLPYPTPNTVHLACCFGQADQVAAGCVAEGGVAWLLYLPHHMWLAVNKQPTPTYVHTHTHRREAAAPYARSNCNQHLGNAHLRQKVCYTCFYLFNAPRFNTTRAPQKL